MQEAHDLMQMMAFSSVAPLNNPLPFSNTPRNDNREEVFRIFGLYPKKFDIGPIGVNFLSRKLIHWLEFYYFQAN